MEWGRRSCSIYIVADAIAESLSLDSHFPGYAFPCKSAATRFHALAVFLFLIVYCDFSGKRCNGAHPSRLAGEMGPTFESPPTASVRLKIPARLRYFKNIVSFSLLFNKT